MLANTATAAALLSVCLLGLTSCGQDEATTVRLRAGVTDGAESATVIYRVDADESTVSVGSDEDLDVEVELSGGFELEIIASNDSDGGGVRCGFSDLVPGGSAARGSATATCRASGSVSGGSADVSFDNTSTDRTEPTGGSV